MITITKATIQRMAANLLDDFDPLVEATLQPKEPNELDINDVQPTNSRSEIDVQNELESNKVEKDQETKGEEQTSSNVKAKKVGCSLNRER